MGIFRNRRFTLVLSAVGIVGAAAALAIGASYALFTSTANPQTATISAQTVTLTEAGTSASSTACTFSDLVPGDSTGNGCTYTVDYTGSAPAWLLLNVSTTSTPGVGGKPLLDNGVYGLIPTISAPSAAGEYSFGTQLFGWGNSTTSNCTSPTATGEVCSRDNNQVVDTYEPLTAGNSWTFTISGAMNVGTPAQNNPYQGGSATITITAWAVQATNNTNNSGHGPEYPSGPIFESVSAPTPTALVVGYNIPVQEYYLSGAGGSEFAATDLTQSSSTSIDTCVYSYTTPPAYNAPSSATTTVDLTLANCSGATPTAGDMLNVTYAYNQNSPGNFLFKAGANLSNLTNYDYPQSPETFWNVKVG